MKSIEIVMLPVRDQQRAKEFYMKLGYRVIAEQPMGKGETWLQMALPEGNTTISLGAFPALICATDDIQESIARLRAHNIEAGSVDDTPWGKFAWLKDPDGNSICLRQQS